MYRNGIAQNQCSAFVFQQEFDHARGKQMCFTVFTVFHPHVLYQLHMRVHLALDLKMFHAHNYIERFIANSDLSIISI